jgi:hypothetical protein
MRHLSASIGTPVLTLATTLAIGVTAGDVDRLDDEATLETAGNDRF